MKYKYLYIIFLFTQYAYAEPVITELRSQSIDLKGAYHVAWIDNTENFVVSFTTNTKKDDLLINSNTFSTTQISCSNKNASSPICNQNKNVTNPIKNIREYKFTDGLSLHQKIEDIIKPLGLAVVYETASLTCDNKYIIYNEPYQLGMMVFNAKSGSKVMYENSGDEQPFAIKSDCGDYIALQSGSNINEYIIYKISGEKLGAISALTEIEYPVFSKKSGFFYIKRHQESQESSQIELYQIPSMSLVHTFKSDLMDISSDNHIVTLSLKENLITSFTIDNNSK